MLVYIKVSGEKKKRVKVDIGDRYFGNECANIILPEINEFDSYFSNIQSDIFTDSL